MLAKLEESYFYLSLVKFVSYPSFNSTRTIFVWGTKALSIMDFSVDLKQHYSVNIAPSKNTSRFQKRQLWQQKLKEMTNTTRNRK